MFIQCLKKINLMKNNRFKRHIEIFQKFEEDKFDEE